jgi:hypothetical protein
MYVLHNQPFSSYLERNIFDAAHAHHRLANCLRNPWHIQGPYHPNLAMGARMWEDVAPPSFACASVWDAPRVARFLIILAKRQKDNRPPSILLRVEMGG